MKTASAFSSRRLDERGLREARGGSVGRRAGRLRWCVLFLGALLMPEAAWGQSAAVIERMDHELWESVGECRGAESYLKSLPAGLHAKEAKECLAWAEVQGCEDARTVERFLADHPEGRFVAEARECLAWLDVRSCEDVEKVGKFQNDFPDGRYAAEAAACVARIVAQVQEEAKRIREKAKRIARIEADFSGEAREALKREQPDAAKSAIERLKEISPEHPEVKDLETGLADLERVLDQRLNDDRAIEELAGKIQALLSERKHEQARAELAAGRKAGLSGKRLRALEDRIDRDALMAEVRALAGAGNVAAARARLAEARKGLLSDEDHAGLKEAIEEAETAGRDALVADMMERVEQDEFEEARELLVRARAQGLPEAHYEELSEHIGRSEREARVSALLPKCTEHVKEGQYEQALKCYHKVLDLEPGPAVEETAKEDVEHIEMLMAWKTAQEEKRYLEFGKKYPDSMYYRQWCNREKPQGVEC